MKYSVIDISSSSISLIIAEADEHKTEIVFKDRLSVSLLHYLDGKKLTERGIEKLVDALKTMKGECEKFGVGQCYLISTASLRVIENCDEVSFAVLEKTGLPVNFLDGKTEAFCDYVANLYYASYESAVLVDLGGKSLEICDLTKGSKEDMMCFDFGLLDIHRKFIRKIQPNEKEAKDIKEFVTEKFDEAKLPKKETFATAVMVGTTNHAVYDIYADYVDLSAEEGVKRIEYKKFKKLVKHLLGDAERSTLILNNAPEKLYLIGPAAIVLKTLFKRFGVRNILVSDRGVKEGYLQLVLEGKESGMYFDFAANAAGGTPRELSAPSEKKKEKRGGKKTEGKAEKEKKEEPKAEKEKKAEKGAKKEKKAERGKEEKAVKPEKTASESAPQSAPQSEKAASESAPQPKRRGRPRKQPPADSEASGEANN